MMVALFVAIRPLLIISIESGRWLFWHQTYPYQSIKVGEGMSSRCYFKSIFKTAVVLSVLVPAVALGAGKAVLLLDDAPSDIHWQDKGTIRIQETDINEYILLRDSKPYMVTEEDGKLLVIDMEGMAEFLAEFGGNPNRNPYNWGQVHTYKETGKKEIVAGIEGNVYAMQFKQGNGQTLHLEAVLTDETVVVELMQQYADTLKAAFNILEVHDLLTMLPKDQRGVLRLGRFMKVDSISNEKPSDDLFVLPGKPIPFGEMLQQ